jgi:hypothetical protein
LFFAWSLLVCTFWQMISLGCSIPFSHNTLRWLVVAFFCNKWTCPHFWI